MEPCRAHRVDRPLVLRVAFRVRRSAAAGSSLQHGQTEHKLCSGRKQLHAAETCQTQGRGLHQSCNNTEDINKKRLELRHNELELGSDLRGSKISITAEAPTTYAIAPAGAASRRRRSCQ